ARLRRPRSRSGPGASASICGPRMPAAALEASAPGMPRSMTVTERPRAARRSPTAHPMMPPPTIATSVVPGLVFRRLSMSPFSDSVRGRARPLKLPLERLRRPHLVVRVDDEGGAAGEALGQGQALFGAEDEDRVVERVGQQ